MKHTTIKKKPEDDYVGPQPRKQLPTETKVDHNYNYAHKSGGNY